MYSLILHKILKVKYFMNNIFLLKNANFFCYFFPFYRKQFELLENFEKKCKNTCKLLHKSLKKKDAFKIERDMDFCIKHTFIMSEKNPNCFKMSCTTVWEFTKKHQQKYQKLKKLFEI